MTEQAKKLLAEIKTRGADFQLTMLGRLLSDCKYYLGAGNRCAANLWAWNERDHLDIMRELCADLKPDWLTLEQIDELEKQMISTEQPRRAEILNKPTMATWRGNSDGLKIFIKTVKHTDGAPYEVVTEQNGKQTAHLLKLSYDEKRGEPFFKVCNRKIYLSACIVDKPAFLAALETLKT